MARRRVLQQHIEGLGEIRDIMNSMKSLAYMETRKLARYIESQSLVVASMEAAATDLLAFHRDVLTQATNDNGVYLLVGSERGFCGDFNQALLARLREFPGTEDAPLVAVGTRLCTLLQHDGRVEAAIAGAGVAEEIEPVLERLIRELAALQQDGRLDNLHVLYHDDQGEVAERRLLPPFQQLVDRMPRPGVPPLIHQRPEDLLIELTDHYLFASLHGILYASLMAESHRRVTHLEGAVDHLDEQTGRLKRRYNAVRQEEIIEEIEVILLPFNPETE